MVKYRVSFDVDLEDDALSVMRMMKQYLKYFRYDNVRVDVNHTGWCDIGLLDIIE